MNPGGEKEERTARDTQPTTDEQQEIPDNVTLVIELGEANPNPKTADYKETRGQRYFYLGTQAALAFIAAIGVGVGVKTLIDLNQSVVAANAQASAAATQAAIADQSMRIGLLPENPRDFKVGFFTEGRRTDESKPLQRRTDHCSIARA